MADTTVELLIKSRWDGAGVTAAQREIQESLRKIQSAQNQLNTSLAGGSEQTEQGMRQASQQSQQAARHIQRVATESEKLREIFSGIGVEIGDAFADTSSIDEVQKRLQRLRQTAQQVQSTAAEQGDFDRTLRAGEAARAVEGLDKKLFGMQGTFKNLGQDMGVFGQIMTNTFNQFGFALFVTSSTIQSIIKLIGGAIKLVRSMGAETQRLGALAVAVNQVGQSSQEFLADIDAVSQGLVAQNRIIENSIKLLNSSNTAIQDLAPGLLELAENAARVGGDIAVAPQVFDQLTDAIVSNEAATISAGGATIRLADATALATIRANRLGRAVTELDKSTAIMDLLASEQERFQEAADRLPDVGENFNKMAGGAQRAFSTIKAAGGAFLDVIANGIDVIFSLISSEGAGLAGFLTSVFRGFTGLSTAIGAAFRIVLRIILEIKNSLSTLDFSSLANAFSALAQKDIPEAIAQIGKFKDSLADVEAPDIDLGNIVSEEVSLALTAFDRMTDGFKSAIGTLETTASGAEITPKIDISNAINQLETLFAPQLLSQRQHIKGIEDIWEDHADKLADINEKLGEKIADIREKALERLEDIEEAHLDNLVKLRDNANKAIARLDEDTEDKRQNIIEDAGDRRERVKKKQADKIAKIEEDLQKKIDDILRKFELARLRALIDRDARALFEAEQRKREELAKAQESAKEKREDAKDDLAKELQDISDNEEKKLRRLDEAANKRRQRLIDDFQERRAEAIAQFEEERSELQEQLEEQLADAQAAAKKQRKEAKKEAAKRLQDLKEAFKERMFLLDAQLLLENARLLEGMNQDTEIFQNAYNDWTNDFDDFLRDYEGQVSDLIDLINSIGDATPGSVPLPDISGGGGGGGGGTGGCVSGSELSFTPSAGQPCSGVPLDRSLTACDGSKWICPSQTQMWARFAGGFGTQTSAPQTTSTPTGPGLLGATSAGTDIGTGLLTGGTRLPVTIEVQGDDTLRQIFEEIAFDAFVEIVN